MGKSWIPAYAGMTDRGMNIVFIGLLIIFPLYPVILSN